MQIKFAKYLQSKNKIHEKTTHPNFNISIDVTRNSGFGS